VYILTEGRHESQRRKITLKYLKEGKEFFLIKNLYKKSFNKNTLIFGIIVHIINTEKR